MARSLKNRGKIIIAVIAVMMIVIIYVLTTLRSTVTEKDIVIYIPENTSFDALMDSVTSGDKISNPALFRKAAHLIKLQDNIISGRYEVSSGATALDVARKIKFGQQSPMKVTFNNIRTIDQLAASLSNNLRADSTAFAEVFLSDSIAESYGFTKAEFIGMFIPNTYELYWTVTPDKFTKRMKTEYDRFWNDERTKKLKRTGLTQKEVATLASIVDEETAKSDEMATIAGVYINRLRKGMMLQADPTVKFAIGDFSIKRIMHKHLNIVSPYNTYRNMGLPPSPIRMPSVAALDAVLNYKDHRYIYFCARADFSGYHAFAETYSEHLRNARKYSAALNKAGIK